MTQFQAGGGQEKPGNTVYTALMLITLLVLGVGIGVIWWKNVQLTDQPWYRFYHIVETENGG
jgi:hypothetical protein